MKLSGPIRLGIVAYGVWLCLVLLVGYGPISDAVDKNAAEDARLAQCLAGRTDFGSEAECGGVWIEGTDNPHKVAVPYAPFIIAAVSPPFLILIGWFAFRWVRRGFETDP
jgi:hypothetical protein